MIDHADICAIVKEGRRTHIGVINDIEFSKVSLADVTVISVRGTELSKILTSSNWMDVVRDLRIAPWYDKRTGWAHAGFLKGARALVDRRIHFYVDKDKPVILAGHSMGAAISLLAAMMMKADGYRVIEWVGFGCPRCLIGKRDLPFTSTSYKYGGDIVTDVPSRWLGYRHSPELTQRGNMRHPNRQDHDLDLYQAFL